MTGIHIKLVRILLGSFASLSLVAACAATEASPLMPSAIPGAPDVVVSTTEMRFTPSEIRLPADAVNLVVRNDGRTRHDLTIPALGLHLVVDPGQTVTAGLRELPRGTYEFHCGVFGHKDAGMRGKVTAE